jgi:NAD-dependent SIR2 family protein deacetylase
MTNLKNFEKAAEIVTNAEALLITAGAGIGVDSGLPDFRGNEGFWKAYPPIAKMGLSFSDMANPRWFQSLPNLAWAFYGHRLNLYRKTIPHQGFTQLLELSLTKPKGYFVFTSNVDGHFQKAGFDQNRIVECHGSIHHCQCNIPCSTDIWDAKELTVNVDEKKFEAIDPLPVCIHCKSIARPNILMFGDWNWLSERTGEQEQQLQLWLNNLNGASLAIMEMGAGNAVPTVRMTSERVARKYNGTLIRINPRDYNVPGNNHSISAGAAEGIKGIYEIIKK